MDEVARLGKEHYANHIRKLVETTENIGRLVLIDVSSGDYELDQLDDNTAFENLKSRRPDSRIYRIRIGYRSVATFGGMLERSSI